MIRDRNNADDESCTFDSLRRAEDQKRPFEHLFREKRLLSMVTMVPWEQALGLSLL